MAQCRETRESVNLIWYERGRAPYLKGGELDFLNRAVRRAELDHPELTSTFELFLHALEESLGLRLPRGDFAEGRRVPRTGPGTAASRAKGRRSLHGAEAGSSLAVLIGRASGLGGNAKAN